MAVSKKWLDGTTEFVRDVKCHHTEPEESSSRLLLRVRAIILLSEDNNRWFDSPGMHVKVSLGKILNPKLLQMCWSAPCVAATAISV